MKSKNAMKTRRIAVVKRPEKTADGFLPANKIPWVGAYIFHRHGYGLVYVGFGNGINLDDEDLFDRDKYGNKIDWYVNIKVYQDNPVEADWIMSRIKAPDEEERSKPGVLFTETDGFTMVFSKRSYPSADLRDLLKEALKCVGFPTDVERRYYLVGTEGRFNWDGRPTKRLRTSQKKDKV